MLEEEHEDFPVQSILAEFGGTMGLFLGISIIQIVSFSGTTLLKFIRIAIKRMNNLKRKCIFKDKNPPKEILGNI